MPIALTTATLNMAVALGCGALIGSERQVRQRMAGLRTNALVALGAAAFVCFSGLFPNEVSPTRVAAQIVSGIGFLGAGIIFRDGFNVHGLNTAATLWCSAAVGMMAGAGAWPFALVLTGLVVFTNLGLRPLVKFLKRHTRSGGKALRGFRLVLSCPAEAEGQARALLLRTLAVGGLHLSEINAQPGEDPGVIDLSVIGTGEGLTDEALELAFSRIAVEPGLGRFRWEMLDEG